MFDDLKTVCVAGASGLVGSNITRAALAKGYRVNGTLRDAGAQDKAPYLRALPGGVNLELFSAEMGNQTSFDAPTRDCDAIFITCLIPVYKGFDGTPARELDDERGWAEVIQPTVDGCLNIMRAAIDNGVKKIIICSSTSSTNPIPPVPLKNEVDHWSDPEQQCRDKKFTSATKAVMEKAAMALAEENDVRLSILLPTLMIGPMVLPGHILEGFMGALHRLTLGERGRHDKTPNDSSSMAHIHDVADLFMAAYENPDASGRYYAVYDSWHWQDIYDVLTPLMPEMVTPEPWTGDKATPTGFDFTRRDSLGVNMRDIPMALTETVRWLQGHPFAT